MSSWGQGSTRATRRVRGQVLDRDEHVCQLMLKGCTVHATEAHHIQGLQGQRRSEATDPDSMIAVCSPCHNQVTEQQRIKAYEAKQAYRNKRRRLPVKPHPGD